MHKPAYRRIALLAPVALILILLLALPLVQLIGLSFKESLSGRMATRDGLTLVNYIKVFTDGFYLSIIGYTVALSILVTAASALVGFPLSYFLWRAPSRWKATLILLVVAPLLVSLVVRIYGWIILLGDSGIINSALVSLGILRFPARMLYTDFSVFIGLLHVQLPFMILSMLAAMERIDPALISAAETLGARRLRAIVEVVLPLSVQGLISGATLVFTLCMTAFVTPQLLGGTRKRVVTTQIFNEFAVLFNWPRGAAFAVILSLVSLAVVFLFLRSTARLPLLRRLQRVEGR